MNDSNSLMNNIVDFIINGSLLQFKQTIVGPCDINRFLLPEIIINPVPSVSGVKVCNSICGPTMLILSVLCERPDFVKFILSQNPDLSIKVNGYNALHYSALTKDIECLKILLTCPFYQKNISAPISEPGIDNSTTNALHIAVSNKNIASAALLLDELPKSVQYFNDKVKIEQNSHNEGKKPDYINEDEESNNESIIDDDDDDDDDDNDNDDDDDYQIHDGIDVNSKTSHGSTSLHIAAYMRDIDMCHLLLNFSADISIKDSKGRTASQIALSTRSKIGNKISNLIQNPPEEIPKTLFQIQYPHTKNPSQRTVHLVEQNPDKKDTSVSKNKKRQYFSSSSSGSSSDSDDDNDNSIQMKKKKKKNKDTETPKLLKMLIQKIDSLNTRIAILEDSVSNVTEPPPQIHSQIIQVHQCIGCNSTYTRMCPTCHHYFCSKCMNLPTIHKCV